MEKNVFCYITICKQVNLERCNRFECPAYYQNHAKEIEGLLFVLWMKYKYPDLHKFWRSCRGWVDATICLWILRARSVRALTWSEVWNLYILPLQPATNHPWREKSGQRRSCKCESERQHLAKDYIHCSPSQYLKKRSFFIQFKV